MSGRWIVLALIVTVGCRTPFRKPATLPCPPEAVPCESAQADCPPDQGAAAECAPPCAPKPQVEVRSGEEVHVHVPRQRVVVPRGGGAPRVAGAGAPAAARTEAIERQQIMQTRQVMLVPQQVLVPFVQTTTTGPIRVNGATETQVLNLAGVATTTTGVAATGLTATGLTATGAGLAATGAGAAVTGAAAAGTGAPGLAAAGVSAAGQRSAAECEALLRQYEDRIQKLTTIAEGLTTQVEQLKVNAARPAAGAPSPPPPPAAATGPRK